jgi:hypothetical protein
MKNLLLLFADFAMNKSGTYRWIAASIMNRIRLISMVLVFSFLGLIVIGSALNMIISDLLKATESQQQLAVTSISAIGLSIVICSLAAICLFFRKSVWGVSSMSAVVEQVPQTKSESSLELSPLLQALSVLLLDFVDERREKRQRKSESFEQIRVREP